MTMEERIAKMQEYHDKAIVAASEYNKASVEKRYDDCEGQKKNMDDAIGEYNALAKQKCYAECLAAEDPMIEAVTRLAYDGLKATEKEDEDGVKTCTIETKSINIDLKAIHDKNKANGGIGQDKQWPYMVERLNVLMTYRVYTEIGLDPVAKLGDTIEVSEITKSIDLGKTPTSNKQLLNQLRTIITAMIGEGPDLGKDESGKELGCAYKVISHDVNYLWSIYTKASNDRFSKVVCPNHNTFRRYIMNVCHHLVTGKPYEAISKAAKTK